MSYDIPMPGAFGHSVLRDEEPEETQRSEMTKEQFMQHCHDDPSSLYERLLSDWRALEAYHLETVAEYKAQIASTAKQAPGTNEATKRLEREKRELKFEAQELRV